MWGDTCVVSFSYCRLFPPSASTDATLCQAKSQAHKMPGTTLLMAFMFDDRHVQGRKGATHSQSRRSGHDRASKNETIKRTLQRGMEASGSGMSLTQQEDNLVDLDGVQVRKGAARHSQ
ncbi:hypothetical protein BaRGS_00005242 [Batillaria attramentaria]|uniref:Uncharacterized protein n=1 Tax=Batillaria attramentaria TaxID=370345 RepID=A0ABD0LX59_9CAEN